MDNALVLSTIVTPVALLDLLLKSAALLSVFALLDRLLEKRVSSNTHHLLWINALLCLTALPFLPTLINHATSNMATTNAWLEITVTPTSTPAGSSTFSYLWLWAVYFVPVIWLLAKMGVAIDHLRRIQQRSGPVTNQTTRVLLSDLRTQLGIKRSVELRSSHQIDSPMSFGLLQPHIILPAQSRHWSPSMMTDVLLHELNHIKRLDWITMMLARFVATLYWINPLVWFAVKRLNDEAENSCDTAVLHAGRNDTDYAGSLLSVAQACIHTPNLTRGGDIPAQMMLGRSNLKTRIHRILEENTMSTQVNKNTSHVKLSWALMLSISAVTLFGIGGERFVYAQSVNSSQSAVDDEMIPLLHVVPVYPARAANRKVEGWVKVNFTVTAAGNVDAQSIDVVDSEPRGMFETSAKRAASEFTFNPRIRNGMPVDVSNVQYVFRYSISDEPEQQATHGNFQYH